MDTPPNETIEHVLESLKSSLFTTLDMGGLHSRNPIAHKWKAPYRTLQLREVVYWRILDLLDQSLVLHKQGHGLGARILLRSAFETLAMLIYLNQQMAKVFANTVNFHVFSKKTETLLLGSRDGSTPVSAVNILTVLDGCDEGYPGIRNMYDRLSESAHPNYEGMSIGYRVIDHKADIVSFKNRWMELYGEKHIDAMMLCIKIFHLEYGAVWQGLFEQLEKWIEANDEALEATKPKPPAAEALD